jgi:aspartyl/asparaginyl-tRNA synthetase
VLSRIIGIDIEMAIERSYLEARSIIDGLLKHVFRSILVNPRAELDHVKRQFPDDDLVFSKDTVTLNFHDRISLLKEDGRTEDGEDLDGYEDLSRRAEVRLGQLAKAPTITF